MGGWMALLVLLAIGLASLYAVMATPQGATVSGTPNVDAGPNKTADSRTDPGGRIITLALDLEQQDGAWKAYVGNVSGTFVLQNSNNRSIYEWPISSSSGEIYLSRNSSLNFGSATCAGQAILNIAHTEMGISASDDDSLNSTFNSTAHSGFSVGTTPVSGCPSTALWANDTVQQQISSAAWQEVLLNISNDLVYAAILNNDNPSGFDNNTYDFQIIVAENRSDATGHVYYFYVELGSG